MKIRKLSAAVTGIVFAAGLAATGAQAANPTPLVKGPPSTAPQSSGGDRLIIKYRAGTAAVSNVSSKLTTVRSAASRAGVVQVRAAGRTAASPLTAQYGRKLGTGSDLVRVSRKLSPAELNSVVTELKADPTVESVQVDRKVYPVRDLKVTAAPGAQPALVPNDPYYTQYQWHLHSATGGINAPAAWDVSTGAGTVVAVLDTGILPNHPDMRSGNHLLAGYDFITDAFVSRRGTDARAPGALDYGDWNDDASQCDVDDSSWHGTHVAGTVAELTNNGVGMAGVAHDAQVLPIRVLGRCGGYTSDIVDAIVWASGGAVPGVPANQHPAEVINLSLGGSGACSTDEQDAVDLASANGSLVVIAAGNSGANAVNHSPGNCDNVVTVGATGITGAKAYYSNYGAAVEISGPGGGVTDGNPNGYVWQAGYTGTTTPTSGAYSYMGMAGTSMASPHVAAVAALVQSALADADRPLLTPPQLSALLIKTARPFPVSVPASTPIGSGIVDAAAALEEALKVPCDPAQDTCAPEATPLVNKVVVGNVAGGTGTEALYSFEAKAGAVLSFLTYGGRGNVDVYVSLGEEPTVTDHDAKSARTGNSETVRFNAPVAGTYYVKLVGAASYSGVSLVARQ
ncbi:MAG: S8 family peptidase [Pseudoxanthomonas sp.]